MPLCIRLLYLLRGRICICRVLIVFPSRQYSNRVGGRDYPLLEISGYGRNDRIRTCDIYIPNVALYHLSHIPMVSHGVCDHTDTSLYSAPITHTCRNGISYMAGYRYFPPREIGAENGSRTHTILLPEDFKSSMSAYSIISAYYIVYLTHIDANL